MANLAQYLADQLLTVFKGTNFVAAPATLYLGLFTTASTQATAGTEVSGGSYARIAITTATGWTAIATSTGRYIANAADLTSAVATAPWGTVVGWELRSASTAGNRWAYGVFDQSQSVTTGKFVTITAGTLVVTAL